MTKFKPNIVTDEDGNSFIDAIDHLEEQTRLLNPDTGCEATQEWPEVPPERPLPPLLDLSDVWSHVTNDTPIPTPAHLSSGLGPDVSVNNAAILVKELKYHILLSTINRASDEETHPSDTLEKQSDNVIQSDSDPTLSTENASKGDTDAPKSIYGASVLLKLVWDLHKDVKTVPRRNYHELATFIGQIHHDITRLRDQNAGAFQAVVDAVGLELTMGLLARMLDGIETEIAVLEHAAFDLLYMCAEHANPKEMHMGMLSFMKKISVTYFEATSYIAMTPIMKLWTKVVTRIESKRFSFLKDFSKYFGKMREGSEGWQSMFMMTRDGKGVDKEGRCDEVPSVMVDFYLELAKVQSSQRASSEIISKQVNDMGRVCLEELEEEQLKAYEADKNSDKKGKGKQGGGGHSLLSEETREWVNERGMTKAKALDLLSDVWAKLAVPQGEDRRVPSELRRNEKKCDVLSKSQDQAEEDMGKLIRAIMEMGWSNPLIACQMARVDMCKNWCEDEEVLRKHLGEDVRSAKERKSSMYSMCEVGQFVCGWLRPSTRMRMSGKRTRGNDYEVKLEGSGLDMVNGMYGLETAMPFLMAVMGQSKESLCLSGVAAMNGLLDVVDGGFETVEEVFQERFGQRAIGREVSVAGIGFTLAIMVGRIEDAGQRRYVYGSLQRVIRMCKHPMGRYVMVESMLHDCERVAVRAQLVTELKDVLRYSDGIGWDGVKVDGVGWEWGMEEASGMTQRFVQVVVSKVMLPRRETLGLLTGLLATGSACLYVAGSDRRHWKQVCEEGADGDVRARVREGLEKRRELVREYVKLGKEVMRTLGMVSEHDVKESMQEKAGKGKAELRLLHEASRETLNKCVSAVGTLDAALSTLQL